MTIKDLGRWESLEMVQRYSRSVCLSGFAAHNGLMLNYSTMPNGNRVPQSNLTSANLYSDYRLVTPTLCHKGVMQFVGMMPTVVFQTIGFIMSLFVEVAFSHEITFM